MNLNIIKKMYYFLFVFLLITMFQIVPNFILISYVSGWNSTVDMAVQAIKGKFYL